MYFIFQFYFFRFHTFLNEIFINFFGQAVLTYLSVVSNNCSPQLSSRFESKLEGNGKKAACGPFSEECLFDFFFFVKSKGLREKNNRRFCDDFLKGTTLSLSLMATIPRKHKKYQVSTSSPSFTCTEIQKNGTNMSAKVRLKITCGVCGKWIFYPETPN